jgi:hypothetical protein
VLALLVAVAIAGCGGAGAKQGTRSAAVSIPAACATKSPLRRLPHEGRTAIPRALAPPGAVAVRLCRYSGYNERPRLALVGSRLIEDPRTIPRFVSELSDLPRRPRVVNFGCSPGDAQIVALLAYPGSQRVTIWVQVQGCRTVSNGSQYREGGGIDQFINWLWTIVTAHQG